MSTRPAEMKPAPERILRGTGTLRLLCAAGALAVLAVCLTVRPSGSVTLPAGAANPPCVALSWNGGAYQANPSPCPEPSPREQQRLADADGDGWDDVLLLDQGTLRLVSERQPNVSAWRSESAWEVIQARLADANLDGRPDIIFALWKSTAQSGRTNHLFIYHFSAGEYRAAWCASALADPIVDFALADLDSDGDNELVVLEQDGLLNAPASNTLTVWRWNGWGFSNEWRSSPGDYAHLTPILEQDRVTRIAVSLRGR